MASSKVPTRKLNSGHSIPLIGYGTGTALFKRDNLDQLDETTVTCVKNAIDTGFLHLDGAELYQNEAELGAAIARSGVPRSSLFVTTKVIHTIDDIPKAIDQALQKLKLDYVDLFLIHSPFYTDSNAKLQDTWKQMEDVARSGKAKSIGVSNFLIPHLEAILQTCSIVPAVNQVEFHPYLQRQNLVPWSNEKGIVTAAFGPLTTITKGKPGPCDEVLERLAKKYGVTESAVALRWCVDQGVAAITTTGRKERLTEYYAATTFELSQDEVQEISREGAKKHLRCNNFMHKWDDSDRR